MAVAESSSESAGQAPRVEARDDGQQVDQQAPDRDAQVATQQQAEQPANQSAEPASRDREQTVEVERRDEVEAASIRRSARRQDVRAADRAAGLAGWRPACRRAARQSHGLWAGRVGSRGAGPQRSGDVLRRAGVAERGGRPTVRRAPLSIHLVLAPRDPRHPAVTVPGCSRSGRPRRGARDPGGPAAVLKPQRRRAAVRARRHALSGHRRRRSGQRSARERAESRDAAGDHHPDRRERCVRAVSLQHPGRQSVPRRARRAARDLRLRPAQSMAHGL